MMIALKPKKLLTFKVGRMKNNNNNNNKKTVEEQDSALDAQSN